MRESTLYKLAFPLVSAFVVASAWVRFFENEHRELLLSHWPTDDDDALNHLLLIQDVLADKSDPELELHGAKIYAVFLSNDPRVETPHRTELLTQAGVFVSPGGSA